MQDVDAEDANGEILDPRPSDHLLTAARCLCLTALLVGVAGLAGRWLASPLLSPARLAPRPTVAAHPRTEPARLRNAAVGHAVALGFGLERARALRLGTPPVRVRAGMPSWRQVLASAAAVGLTMSVLELLHSHHAPAAATALLITTGLAKPGAPLIGLVVGLAIVVTLGPLCARWPLPWRDGPSTMSRPVGVTSGWPLTAGGPR